MTQNVLGLVSVKLDSPLMVAAVAFAVVRHFEGIEKSWVDLVDLNEIRFSNG